jgi:hypothetical protein
VAKRDAGAATPAKYFFVRKESLRDAETLFVFIHRKKKGKDDISVICKFVLWELHFGGTIDN